MVQQVHSPVDADEAIRQMVAIIVDGWDPVQVILFGSRARGDNREDSDADLLVVLDEVDDHGGLRLAMNNALDCTRMRRDIKLATPADIVRMATVAGTIERAAMVEGKTLHVRGRGDPVTDAVLQWLEIAQRDLRGAGNQMAADPTEPALACFHAQQVAEKSLKAALVAEGIDPPRSHDLNELRDLLPDTWEIPGTIAELKRVSEWAEKSRYAYDVEDFVDPTATWGISLAQAIHDAVTSELTRRGVIAEQ